MESSMNQKKKRKKKTKYIIIIAVLVVILIIQMLVLWKDVSWKKEKQEQEKETAEEILEFPYSLDDGKLEITSLFQSSIDNPDCENATGENIASIEVKNQSGKFLVSANITVILSDDTELQFELVDIPAESSVWAFETSNIEITEQPKCKTIECEAVYEESNPMMTEELSIEADGTTVNISNLTDTNLTNINVSFHCLFDEDVYFGGKTYIYPIDVLSVGETVSLEVEECYLGQADAVRVTGINE